MDFKTDHIQGFRIDLKQIEALVEFSCLCMVVAFILGIALGVLLGAAWPK